MNQASETQSGSSIPPLPPSAIQPARREFLRVALTLGFGAAAIGAGIYNLNTRLPVQAQGAALPLLAFDDIGKGSLASLAKIDAWTPVNITLTMRDAYKLRSRPQQVYVRRIKEGDAVDCFAALSPTCPHAGCSVDLRRGDAEKQTPDFFQCPCHSAKFDVKGEKQSGPAPRHMDGLTLSEGIQNGRRFLMIDWRDYLPGSSEQKTR